MPVVVIGLQGGRADGGEPTFDGQPMQAGIHLRWSIRPELGFPSGGFWLCRRVANPAQPMIPLPGPATAAKVQRAASGLPPVDHDESTSS